MNIGTHPSLTPSPSPFNTLYNQDRQKRVDESRAEFVWRASPSLGPGTQVRLYNLLNISKQPIKHVDNSKQPIHNLHNSE